MACLRIAGALGRATGFPPDLELAALGEMMLSQLQVRHEFAQLHGAAERAGDDELATRLAAMLERAATGGLVVDQSGGNSFRKVHANAVLTLVRTGRPDPYAGTRGPLGAGHVGLLRTFDRRARRHSYATGGCAPQTLVAELGALMAPGAGAEIPVWILADGRVVTDEYIPETAGANGWSRCLFCLAPLRSAEHSVARRVRLALRRALDAVLLPAPPAACVPQLTQPAGCLFEQPREDRLPLWSGLHPVIGDQLLTWSPTTIEQAGYAEPRLLGYVVAVAPHTGQLGTLATPLVPWAGAGQAILDSL
jgi:hypothetical protein